MFSGSPEAKESIASRSEANYPIIDKESGIWDARRNQKLLRFVTVIAYIFFVSLAAIVLSLYYYFFHVPHMGTSGLIDNRISDDSLKSSADFSAQAPIESFVGRGRKRFPMQHNVNHFPLEANSQAVVTPSLTHQPKCEDQTETLSPSQPEETVGPETTTSSIAVQFTRHESPPETVAQALSVIPRTDNSLPTVPSLYHMISRRVRVKPGTAFHDQDKAVTVSDSNYDN
jgi:hypothetical protein